MMKRIIILGMVFYWVFSLFGSESFALYKLFDKRLQLIMRADEYFVWRVARNARQGLEYSQALTVWRHRFQAEGTLTLFEQEDTLINFYTWINFYYEAQPSFNEKINHAMDADQRHNKYQLPFFRKDDILQECYVDYNKGPWTFRVGKQSVVWGDMTLERTTDVVNPLDLRYSTPGIDEFDELKIALYMLRGIYETSLPGNIVIEGIFNPGDYQRTRTGIQGTDRGAPPVPNEALGDMGLIAALDTFKDRVPRFALDNASGGVRVRGQLRPKIFNKYYEFLVSLQYYNALDNPIVTDFEMRSEWIGRFMAGRANGKINELPSGTFYEAKRYEMVGLGIQTEEPNLIKSVLVFEAAYFWGLDFNTTHKLAPGDTSFETTGRTEIDFFTYGLSIRRPTNQMFLKNIDHTARGIADISLTLYQGWYLTNKISEIKKPGDFSYDNKSETALTCSYMTDFISKQLTFVTNFLYNTRNWGYYTLSLTYAPTTAWKVTVGTLQGYANTPMDSGTASGHADDRVFMKIKYEF
jgi:hypothetical protein